MTAADRAGNGRPQAAGSGYTFQANFEKADGSLYSYKSFKTYGGAKRYIEREWWLFRNYRNITEWAISRECQTDWTRTCVLAQSVGFTAKTWFRNRSEADRWVKP